MLSREENEARCILEDLAQEVQQKDASPDDLNAGALTEESE